MTLTDHAALDQFNHWMLHKKPNLKSISAVIYDNMLPMITPEHLATIVHTYWKVYKTIYTEVEERANRARTEKRTMLLQKKLEKANEIMEIISSPAMKNAIVNHVKRSIIAQKTYQTEVSGARKIEIRNQNPYIVPAITV